MSDHRPQGGNGFHFTDMSHGLVTLYAFVCVCGVGGGVGMGSLAENCIG